MKKMLVVLLATFFAMVSLAAAADIEGTIQSVDPANSQVVLQDGTTLTTDENTTITMGGNEAKLEELKEGTKVKASYEEKDGKNVASSVEVSGE